VTAEGFASVGDLGWVDDDGYLFIADRRTDLIISGGANVFPAEVEAALTEHPAVTDAAVVGLPDDEWGARVHAVVEVVPGAAVTDAELDAHCRARIAAYKVPRSYELVDALPRNEAGKIRRTALVPGQPSA
jgi:bile acid-coenzyme A ligase